MGGGHIPSLTLHSSKSKLDYLPYYFGCVYTWPMLAKADKYYTQTYYEDTIVGSLNLKVKGQTAG